MHGLTAGQQRQIASALERAFGAPDEPRLPPAAEGLLDLELLRQAAGPVVSHEAGVTLGLYRRHCADCHGLSGDGAGPTSLYQDPYPRDLRRGVFKWKSTYRNRPPTTGDLLGVLQRGVPGTAMPSFELVAETERATLVEYVKYLAIRGQLERELAWFVAEELGPGEAIDDGLVEQLLSPIVEAWREAPQRVLVAEEPSDWMNAEHLAAGHDLFHGERAGCAKCHGAEGEGLVASGAVSLDDYDVWSRERREAALKAETDDERAALATALPPVTAAPGPITPGSLRGGEEPIDLYRRVHQGVAGAPMPAVGPTEGEASGALSDNEIWELAAYVASLAEVGSPPVSADKNE
ncbi:cytochrome c [Pseudobythopirellula maris]|uniref:cytochrome c n=1 Tax=Pseudobythopirellula maris TaxID=2527991 RepID=UPI0018D2BDA8|nr:cytochrome c [Pseudobythopirellula maris]